ncbi:MAG: FHA domain-containing protein [Magnetococcales bacterium]|nr:FHA domain-containing protein [Magnetococcales bacterium]
MRDVRDFDLIPGLGTADRTVPGGCSLCVLNGPGVGREWPLNQARMLLGRSDPPSVMVQIDLTACELGVEPMISRRHAEVHWIEGRMYLVDLGSRNGTRINGVALTPEEGARISLPAALHPGDRIQLADLELQFVCRGGV